jgi:hypothetical protein
VDLLGHLKMSHLALKFFDLLLSTRGTPALAGGLASTCVGRAHRGSNSRPTFSRLFRGHPQRPLSARPR